VLGGWLIEQFGWPAVFWYRAPIAFTALALAILLPADIPFKGPVPAFDFQGTGLLVISLASFVAMLTLARQSDGALLPLFMLALWIVSTLLFIRQERRVLEPVIHVQFYGNPAFAGIQFATLAINFFNFTILLVPYLMGARGDTSLVLAGLMLGLYPLGQILAGLIGARLSKTVTSVMLVRTGLTIAALGVIATGLASNGPSLAILGAGLFTAGFGLGTFQVGNLDLTTTILPVSARGVAGSLVNVARLLGIVIGAAVITWIFDAFAQPDRLAQFRSTFLLLGSLQLALALLLSLTLFRRGDKNNALA
jgi:MFS family permease